MTIARMAIDTGYETAAVYAWARQVGFGQVAPIKGLEGFKRASPVTGPTFVDATIAGKRLRRGARLWTIATSTFKAETYRFLRLDPPETSPADGERFPPGFLHLPGWVDAEWLKQLTAEQLVTVKNKRGFAKLEWQKLRERNEALDCRVYARAAAWILGADRWSDARWEELERQLMIETASATPKPLAKSSPQPTARRRMVRSSYMGWGSVGERALNNAGISVDQRQQHARRALRRTSVLFPVQKRGLLHADTLCKLGLRKTRARANGLHVRFRNLDLVDRYQGFSARMGNGFLEALFDAFEGVAHLALL
jgi:hypothetical protein